jgi:aspartate--ammonia ligase
MTSGQIAETIQEKQKIRLIPKDYIPRLGLIDTQRGIKLIKDTFERELSRELSLVRVSAPRFLKVGDGLQDDLAGTQLPVSFKAQFSPASLEMVHSLAKWKRHSLGRFGFKPGTGLYTDMDAVRKDEIVDATHSIYVDQWDWERVITKEQRTISFLKETVRKIYSAIRCTQQRLAEEFPLLAPSLPEEISFIHSEELEKLYPELSPRRREQIAARKHGAVFIIGIGHPLSSGKPHDLRAADYDDWSTEADSGRKGLNGDIIVWDEVIQDSLELSSMGIRVDSGSLLRQLSMMGLDERRSLPFHRGIIEGSTPLTIGGGIGQSRLCLLLLEKAHIGEVQSSVWPEETSEELESRGIILL